ncbi:hypothetical protein AMJ39_03950 [candidate division TA06 bacterium DG_24]|uniref:DUF885 domain-containing protein n=2 Tax=Bacteria division TA06 TaxID=1156500 RepID=A0A0S8GCA2_UNCT6|nr:MAG: hypothetical protein AMJ39_03950 [candidate division TA06 bacterium DG_24]KPK70661.1 MAG: hypothetical protein AMJ82_02640 [candidate division TA06 bacterium SM23_40]
MDQATKFTGFVDRFLDEMWKRNPVWATSLGIHDYDHLLGRFDPAAIEEDLSFLKQTRQQLEQEIDRDALPADETDDYDLLVRFLDIEVNDIAERHLHETYPTIYPSIGLSGTFVPLVREFAPLEERLERIVERLGHIPRVLEEGMGNLRNPAKLHTQIAMESTKSGISFYEKAVPGFAKDLPAIAGPLNEACSKAAEAMGRYYEFLEKDLLPRSTGDFALGKDLFDWRLKHSHLLDFDHRELLAFGEEVFATTEEELTSLARQIDPQRPWPELVEELKNAHPGPEELLSFYRSEMERSRNFVVDRDLVTVPEGQDLNIIETPVFQRNLLPYAAYMSPAPFEEKQTGHFFVTPIDETLSEEQKAERLKGHSRYKVVVVALHEGYPGHHLQLVHANQRPSKMRKIAHNTVFIEGWALYCEEMMYEQGFYPDRETRLFQLKDTLWRAARVILDASLHTQRMSFEEALDFLVDRVKVERMNALAEVKRYTTTPTQPMSYLVGRREILNMRDEYSAAKGGTFNLKEFHDRLISYGSMPPALVRRRMFG